MTSRVVEAADVATLIERYDRPGPRYTSYPTAVEFHPGFTAEHYRARLAIAAAERIQPISLYLHVPFCESRCAYCGCAVIATKKRDVATTYLEYLEREIGMVAAALGGRRTAVQYHWGGGTPTYLSAEQIARLDGVVQRHFDITPDAERAIEIDPRVTTREQLVLLRKLGFNRLSFGVQDFTKAVQEAIQRRQSEAETRQLYWTARDAGFESINFDLVYGLPCQTVESFQRTLASVVDMLPDRIAVYSYAHVPWLRPNQKAIDPLDLPDAIQKRALLGAAIESFTGAGYESIGMDHFALPDDDLAIAARERRLHRNFMGYTTRPAPDSIALGVSAISDVAGAFSQNHKSLARYYEAIDAGRLPVERGYALTDDDHLRRFVIAELMCNFRLERRQLRDRFDIEMGDYFKPEIELLCEPGGPVADGLLEASPEALTVTDRGRLFVRNICMAFDRYLAAHQNRPVFSRTI
ncbi:MAG TPA: oxygen-independent coproporphyrinogen III oxidase [Vicinamibacterales bacterium]|nr:oxygen-independent coproporphyrinogen III oxidase [Vicinamibacterales bacterium]